MNFTTNLGSNVIFDSKSELASVLVIDGNTKIIGNVCIYGWLFSYTDMVMIFLLIIFYIWLLYLTIFKKDKVN